MTSPNSPRGIYGIFCRFIRGQGIPGLAPVWRLLAGILAPIWRLLAHALGFIWRPVSALFNWLWTRVVPVIWLCAYVVAAAVAVALIFMFNDQGQDLLRIAAEGERRWWNIAFLLGSILLGLTLWYGARVLLARNFTGRKETWDRIERGRTLLPRMLGASVPFSVGVGFLLVEGADRVATWLLGALYIAVSIGLWWFLTRRRQLRLCGLPLVANPERGIKEPVISFGRVNWLLVYAAALVTLVLVTAFVIWPVGAPRLLGTPAIVVLAFAGIALFGSLVLTYWPLSKGQPGATALVLILAVAFGYTNDNHWIRTAAEVPALERLGAVGQFERWSGVNPTDRTIDGRRPVILVAAAGGGIRAAYWTATTLATLESIDGFGQGLFAISGVSGGSVGAAVYTAVKRDQLDGRGYPKTLDVVKRGLGEDFLSPIVAGLLFPDLMQRFFPVPFAWADRQRFLELGFEQALRRPDNPLSQPFTALYAGGPGDHLPSLLFNTTVVGSGRRAVISNIALDGFTDTLDLMADGFSTRNVLLSSAAGASARFTYVSPAGSLEGIGEKDAQKIRVVDGGYFENSGAASAADLLNLITSQPIYPILVLIRNDPEAPPVCVGRSGGTAIGPGPAGPPAKHFLSEIASPIRALLNARTARGRLAEVAAAKRVEAIGGAVVEVSLAAVAKATMDKAASDAERERIKGRLVEPPLGWSLSQAARTAMDDTLAEAARQALDAPADQIRGLALEIASLRAKLDPESTQATYRTCGAR